MHQHFLRADLQEIRAFRCPVREDHTCLHAAGFRRVALHQTAQLRFPMRMRHSTCHQRFHIDEILGHAGRVIKIGHPPRHACAKVRTDPAKDHRNTPRHVFAAVGPAALDHHRSTTIAHREPLTRPARRKQEPVRRAVQNRVPDDRVIRRHQRRRHHRPHHDQPAGQALAHIIVGIPHDFQFQPAHRKGPQRLPARPRQLHVQMVRLQPVAHPEFLNDVTARPRPDGPVRVAHGIGQLHLFAILKEPRPVFHDVRVQRIRHRIARFRAVIGDPICPIHRDQQRVQVQIIQIGRTPADLSQQIRPPDNLIHRPRPDLRQNLAYFLRIEGDQVHHLVRGAREFRPQIRVLRADPDRTRIRLALPHHDAAHRDQGRRADPVFFGPHHRRHHHVTARPQTAICPQRHPFAQVVHRQNLMRLGQPHFPRQPSILDTRRRRRPRAPVVTRDQDHIRLGLRHPRRNRAHARRRHQLHRHLGARVDLLQVIDQLRQILDGIDVMVRRR